MEVLWLDYLKAIAQNLENTPSYPLGDDTAQAGVHLFKNDVVPDPSVSPGTQFEEADYGGYARQDYPPVDSAPYVFRDPATGQWVVQLGTGFHFQPTSSTNLPQTIYGWYLCAGSGTTTGMKAERFEEPVVLTTVDDAVDFEAKINFLLGGIA